MAGILHGQAAVNELRKQLGRDPTDIETQIAMEEGYSKDTYRDTNNVLTSGWGQTGDNMGLPLDEVALKYAKRTQKLIPNYNTLPDFVKNRAFDAAYRGTLGQSPMTVNLMNAGQYGDAADEFLNNQEYRDAVMSGSGVAARMERTADAFREYGNQKPKQVVPKMNRQQMLEEEYKKQGQYGQYPTDRQVRKQVRADNTAAGGNAVSSLFSNLFNNNTAVAPMSTPAVIDMNGGQVDPRVPAAPQPMFSKVLQKIRAGQPVPPAAIPVTNSIPSLSQFTDPDAVSPTQYNTYNNNKTSIFDDYEGLNVAQGIGRGLGQTYDTVKDTLLGANRQAVKLLHLPQDMGDALDSDIQVGKDVIDSFMGSNVPVPVPVAPIQQKPALTNQQQALLSGNKYVPAPVISPEEAAEQDRQDKIVTERASIVFNPAKKTDKTPIAPEIVKQSKFTLDKPTKVPAITEKTVDEIVTEASVTPSDDGLPGGTSVNPSKGTATDNNGEPLPIKEDQVKDIFGKAASGFGDIFSGPDLKRMTLYTIGGLLSGGSLQGSFKWAGMKVMQEQGIKQANKVAADAKTLDFKRDVAKAATVTQVAKDAAKELVVTNRNKAEVLAEATRLYREGDINAKIEAAYVLAENTRTNANIKAFHDLVKDQNKFNKSTGERYRYVVTGGELDGKNIPIVEYKMEGGNKWFAETPNGLIPLSEFESAIADENSPYYGSVHKYNASDTRKGRADSMNAYINGGVKDNIRATWKSHGLDPDKSVKLHSSILPYMKDKGYKIYDANLQMDLLNVITLAVDDAAKDVAYNNKPVDNIGPYVNKMLISTAINAPNQGAWHISGSDNKSVDPNIIEKFTDQMMKDSGNNYMQVKEAFKGYYSDFKAARKAGTLKDEKLLDGENQFSVYLRKKLAE